MTKRKEVSCSCLLNHVSQLSTTVEDALGNQCVLKGNPVPLRLLLVSEVAVHSHFNVLSKYIMTGRGDKRGCSHQGSLEKGEQGQGLNILSKGASPFTKIPPTRPHLVKVVPHPRNGLVW